MPKKPQEEKQQEINIDSNRKPSKTELKEQTMKHPFTKIAKAYGVSDNAVRKWCKSYNLPYKKKDIKKEKEKYK